MKLYVELQDPTIELKLNAEDSSGKKASISVGFFRYDSKKSSLYLKELQELFLALAEKAENLAEEGSLDTSSIDAFFARHICYILKSKVITVDDDGKKTSLTISDTRKAIEVSGLWENSEECLAVLLENFLSSSPWRSAFNEGIQKALTNTKLDEDRLKN